MRQSIAMKAVPCLGLALLGTSCGITPLERDRYLDRPFSSGSTIAELHATELRQAELKKKDPHAAKLAEAEKNLQAGVTAKSVSVSLPAGFAPPQKTGLGAGGKGRAVVHSAPVALKH